MAVGAIALAAATSACGPIQSHATSGNSGDYAINVYSGWVQRWNPCQTIHYRVNTDMAPGQLGRVLSAVASVSQATGLRFSYDGSTSYVPQQGSWNQPADLVIAFAQHNGSGGGSTYLSGANQLGEGGFQSTYMTGSNGQVTSYKITKGYAVIDATAFGYSSDLVRNDTLLHELGHAVGLNHARYTSEIMYPVISNYSPNGYTAGDLAGLAKVGASNGCIN
jgi:hypothetical protein